jgi:hypothetical protein
VELLKDPHGTVIIQIVASRQFPAPGIVDDHAGAKLSSLDDCLGFTPIFHALPGSLCKKEIDRALVVAFATLKKSV